MRIKVFIIGMTFLFNANLLALGLGDIQVFSKFDEPLRAQINFLNSYEIERGKILVALATESDYNLARVERQPIHSELRFKLDYSGREPVVSVTTVSPVKTSFIKFLVQARWPQGKLLREYVVRLNPNNGGGVSDNIKAYNPQSVANDNRQPPTPDRNIPVSSGGAALPPPPDVRLPGQNTESQKPSGQSYSIQNKYQNRREEPVTVAPSSVEPQTSDYNFLASNSWQVRKGETLWSIATIISRRFNTSVHKTAKALHQYNFSAFLNGNINSLKTDAVLQIPTVAQVNAIPLNTAVSSLNSSVTNPAVIPVISNDAQTDAPTVIESAQPLIQDTLNESMDGFQQQLEKIRLENADVQNQMRELRNQVNDIESILEINNKELNKLSIGRTGLLNIKNSGPEQYILIATVALLVLIAVSILWFLIYLAYQRINNRIDNTLLSAAAAPIKETDSPENETTEKVSWRKRLEEKRQEVKADKVVKNDSNGVDSKAGKLAGNPTPMLDIPVVTTSVTPLNATQASQPENEFEAEKSVQKKDEFDGLISDDSEDSVQLELAQAYLDLGDTKGAEELLMEVLENGTVNQRRKAKLLLSQSSWS